MRRLLLFSLFAVLTGCTPVIDARLRLIDVSRKGLAAVSQSLDDRQQAVAALQAAERKQLDAAFDADIRQKTPLTDAWVIEARTAYAAAIDQFAARARQSETAAAADKQNLAAIDAALAQVEAYDRTQLSLISLFGERK